MEETPNETQAIQPTQRRTRRRPIAEYQAKINRLEELLQKSQDQNDQLMTLIAQNAGQPQASPQMVGVMQFMPAKPDPTPRPEGIRVRLELINQDLQTGDPFSKFVRVMPARTDDPETIDPRFCVFCTQNVCEIYGHDEITGAPTDEQLKTIKQLHRQHLMDMKALKGSRALYKDPRYAYKVMEYRLYADHYELRAKILGRVADVVGKSLNGELVSSEEDTQLRIKRWEQDCKQIAQGMMKR